MADFGNIQTPNFAQAALGGYAAGQAVGKQRRRDEAIATYQSDPEGGIEALTTVDPALAEQLRKNSDARERRAAYAGLYAPQPAAPALGSQTAALGAPAAPVAAPGAMQAPMQPPAMPAPAGGLQVNQEALQRLAAIDPEGAMKVTQFAATARKEQVEAFKAHAEVKGQLALYLKSLPPEQRPAAYQAAMPELMQRGFVAQASEGMNFDDAALDRDVALAVPTVQALTQARADRTEARAERRAQTADEIAQAGLGIRREALTIARERAKTPGLSQDNSDLGYLLEGN